MNASAAGTGAEPMIRTVALRVDYEDVTAVRDLYLNIGRGEIYGLIGPNGAGKTTTIRVLATLLEPTYGEVYINGIDITEEPAAVHALLGYMPDEPPVDEELRVWEFLDLFAASYRIPKSERRDRIEEFLRLANLEKKRDAFTGTLSRGMKQRLILAKTLLHDPEVLLLDEPASGLDPMARIELRQMLKRLVGTGKTVLISSHILAELSDFCTSIGILEKGRMVVQGSIAEIARRMTPHRRIRLRTLDPVDRVLKVLESMDHILEVEPHDDHVLVHFTGDEDQEAQLLTGLVHAGLRVVTFVEETLDVEEIFMQIGAREVQ